MNNKKKSFNESDNTNIINSKKDKNQLTPNLKTNEVDNQKNKNNNSNYQINQFSENFIKRKQIVQNNLSMKSTNNNNLLNQIIAGDKKNNNKKETNDGDNISFEVKVLFKRKFNKDNENYLNRDGAKKLEQIQMENNINYY